MPVALQSLCSTLLMLHVESVLSVCNVSVRTVDFGCHLDWECPDATPSTTFTVQSKHGTSWKNVSDCVQISRRSCDLSNVFTNLNTLNSVRLSSEGLRDWINETRYCDVINDDAATFSPPSINISMENGSIWVMVHFSCASCVSYRLEEEESREGSGEESGEEVETLCLCPDNFLVTVMLYNKHKPLDIQVRSAQVMDEKPFRAEFGFVLSGQVYCAVANFTYDGPLFGVPSPPSPPQCISIPAKNESLVIVIVVIVIVCAVLIILGMVFFLLWKRCSSPEPPLPKALALLYDQEIQNATFPDSSRTISDGHSSESDRISVVYLTFFTDMDNQSYYHSSQSLGNGYYKSPILHDPGSAEESSGGLETDGTNCFELLQTTHLILERGERCSYLDESDEILNIPLSSVLVKCTEQDETTTDDLEQYEDQMQEER